MIRTLSGPTRRRDWRARLLVYLDEVAAGRGVSVPLDCGLFSAGAVRAMTGVDPAAAWRGRYRTIDQGLAMLNDDGFLDHVDFAKHLFEVRDRVTDAVTGDLAVVDLETGPALAVVAKTSVLLADVRGGYSARPLGEARMNFIVPFNTDGI